MLIPGAYVPTDLMNNVIRSKIRNYGVEGNYTKCNLRSCLNQSSTQTYRTLLLTKHHKQTLNKQTNLVMYHKLK